MISHPVPSPPNRSLASAQERLPTLGEGPSKSLSIPALSSPSYAAFVQGFASTASDTLTILSVNGHTVTVRLAARQTDGAVITYQGTYTVDDGVIVASDVKQIG